MKITVKIHQEQSILHAAWMMVSHFYLSVFLRVWYSVPYGHNLHKWGFREVIWWQNGNSFAKQQRVVNQKVEDLNVVIPRKENLPWAVLSATVHLSLMLYLDCEFSSTYFLFVQNFCISIFLHTVLGCLVLMKKSSIFFQKPQKKSTFYNFPS